MLSLLSKISCASWLVYATHATDQDAKRVKSLILDVKIDRVHTGSGTSVVRLIVERAAGRLDDRATAVFTGHPMLVPVPGSGLTKAHTVWPAQRVCQELVRHGLGDDVLPVLTRVTAVPKSAGSTKRPSLEQHVASLKVQGRLGPPNRLLLVDDVVTSGTTMMACAMKLAQAFPALPIGGFALARVLSEGNPSRVFEPLVERIVIHDQWCVRRALEGRTASGR